MQRVKRSWKSPIRSVVLFLQDTKIRPFYIFLGFLILSAAFMVGIEQGTNQQFGNFFDGLYWSIITFSTTGYGDKVPSSVVGKILAIFTVFFGIGATTLLSGTLASFLVERNTKARRGLMEYKKLKNHLIICGWKEDMEEILLDILRVSPDLKAENMVVVSNVEPEKVEALKEHPELKGLKFVRGDYSSETSLLRANVKGARKVLVLADSLESQTPSEVDARTVMTVLTLRALSKDLYICAEVLDKKYETYLRHAQCNEILFSREFSRRILANTSATNGMSHILYELLSQENSHSRIVTRPIPPEFQGKTYGEYKKTFLENPRQILLGILENTGSPNRIKIESLREAQKTSDVSQLIINLQKVKGMETNRPFLLPDASYPIQNYSLAILLERVEE
ncbi:MAG: potassium channel protein [Spirochaetales bacterium]|nr:potassium channel protein [Spirochaetales bacterium]